MWYYRWYIIELSYKDWKSLSPLRNSFLLLNLFNWSKSIICLCRQPSKRPFCRILPLCIKHWCCTRFHSVLQGRSEVTAPELKNNLCRIRTLCDILQRTIGRNYLPGRIRSQQCQYRAMWSYSTRYMYISALNQYFSNDIVS